MKKTKLSAFGNSRGGFYDCQFDWPEDCFLQGGERGIVFSKNGNYRTAFIEAFPKNPNTFIRGEGETVEEAEKNAWEKYQKIVNCPNHEYEKRGYTNGLGFCKHCNLSKSKAFELEQYCVVCNKPTNWAISKKEQWYCEEHSEQMPEEDKLDWHKRGFLD